MKNSILFSIILILLNLIILHKSYSDEEFNFDVTNIEILKNGTLFKGTNKGIITSENGVIINANTFEYDKTKNILKAFGNVKVEDRIENFIIFSDSIIYEKNDEIIISESNSRAQDSEGKIITADKFKYNKRENILDAKGDVIIKDNINNYKLFSEEITYFKSKDKLITKGKTTSKIMSKYEINSKDVLFKIGSNELSSGKKTTIKDDNKNVYTLDNFQYLMNEEILKGNNIVVISNFDLPTSDKLYFSSAIIDLKTHNFTAKDTLIEVHNNVFGNKQNNPRLKSVSSNKKGNVTTLKKGVFTSCRINEKCPSWSIKAEQIKHDKSKKQMIYKNAFLRILDVPVLYFPTFFHPDPSVKRQSGLLQPQLNNSHILGNSLTLPYFYAHSVNKDFTFTPTFFDENMQMLQTEYREVGKNFNLITDFGFTKGYKSSKLKEKKNITHFFGKLDFDLELDNFSTSRFLINSEKVSNDTYLKIFDANITNSEVRPNNFDVLNNEIKLYLNNEAYDFTIGFQSFEDLGLKHSDRYQYVLPYFDFNKLLVSNFKNGSINLSTSGINELKNTNNLRSRLINDISYRGFDFITNSGVKNNININFKNLNSIGKKDQEYKSSPQIELMSNIEFLSTYPLIKTDEKYKDYLIPKISLRFNSSDMKDYSSSDKKININNIFSNNRLGITDSFEAGKSLTLGLDFKKEKLKNINKYFNVKLGAVLRDKEEKNIPKISTLNRKSSNLFGSISNNLSEHINIDYNFAIDNNLRTFEYNDIRTKISVNNLITEFSFLEESGEMGNSSFLENTTTLSIDENNFIKFNSRRNRKLNLTEFYDLVYEYKNDCLVAGIKYKKTYYEDRDLKPSEDLFFSVTLIPLTTYEHKINK